MPLEWTLPMTKLLARLPDADLEHLLAVATEIAGTDATPTLAGDAFVELAAPGVGKEIALAGIAADLGLTAADVMAFGDHLTDAAMIQWAGSGVAVANAHPAVLDGRRRGDGGRTTTTALRSSSNGSLTRSGARRSERSRR